MATGDGSPISSVIVSDSIVSPVVYLSGDDDGDGWLETGEAWWYRATYVIGALDPDPLINLATMSGIDGNGEVVTGNVTHALDIEFEPAIRISKVGPSFAQIGDTLHYVYAVTYDGAYGDGSPVLSLVVEDDRVDLLAYTGGDDGDGLFEAGETWSYESTYVVQPGDPSPLTSTYRARGFDRDGDVVMDQHSFAIPIYGEIRPRLYLPILFRNW
jgi:hypothetical protein